MTGLWKERRSAADMALAASAGQFDLPMALGVAGAVLVAAAVVAAVARDALDEERRLAVLAGERVAAGAAEFALAFLKPVLHRHALVEDEALALPQAVLRRDFLEIFEDAAPEVKHL